MPRRKHTTDEERVQAIREYHKRYYEAHRDVLTARSRQWRAERKPARADAPLQQVNPVA